MTALRILPVLAATLMLAACGGTPVDAPLNEAQAQALGRAPDPTTVMTERWSKVFNDTAWVVKAANDMGYEAKPPVATNGTPAYRITGNTQVLPNSKSPVTVTTRFTATGPAANAIDTIQFAFSINDITNDETKATRDALKIPKRIVNGFLGRFQVGSGDETITALRLYQASRVKKYVATITVTPVPEADPKARTVIVTITKAGAPAPAASSFKP